MECIRKDNSKIKFTTIIEDNKNADIFRHFKGNTYKIITIAKDSETLEDTIIYQGQYDDNPCWVRKIEDFFDEVDKNKYPDIEQKYRFEKIINKHKED